MRKYETTVLIKPTLEPEKANEVSEKLVKLIEDNNGKIITKSELESNKIQFEVKGHNSAYWLVINFEVEPNFIDEFERICRIDDNIIRYIVLKLEETKKTNKKVKKVKKINKIEE